MTVSRRPATAAGTAALGLCIWGLGRVDAFFVSHSFAASVARTAPGRPVRRSMTTQVSMVIPPPNWGYLTEKDEVNDYPDYVPNDEVPGLYKPGSLKEHSPGCDLPVDTFVHGGAIVCNFHDLADDARPERIPMTMFIDRAGLTLRPSDIAMLEENVQRDRRRRAKARMDRYAGEPDEELVDDTLEDVTTAEEKMSALPVDMPSPPVQFDHNDGFDDEYGDDGSGSEIDGTSVFD